VCSTALLISKYRPHALAEHLKIYWQRINAPKRPRACDKARLWAEQCLLMLENHEYDAAVQCMMEHPESAWEDGRFQHAVVTVRNQELYLLQGRDVVSFYLELAPLKLNQLLKQLANKLAGPRERGPAVPHDRRQPPAAHHALPQGLCRRKMWPDQVRRPRQATELVDHGQGEENDLDRGSLARKARQGFE
jgi:hypothetical protein